MHILTITSSPRSMCPEMRLTLLRGGDRPSYKHSRHSTKGFPPPGVQAPMQGFIPLGVPTTQLLRWDILHSETNVNLTLQSRFLRLEELLTGTADGISTTQEPCHPSSLPFQSTFRTRLLESWSTFHGDNQFQTKVMTKQPDKIQTTLPFKKLLLLLQVFDYIKLHYIL